MNRLKNNQGRLALIVSVLVVIIFAGAASAQLEIQSNGIVVDQGDRRIDTAQPFKRIISLYGAHTENLFALGLKAEIIGVSRNEAYPPEALSKPVFSYHDDSEKFLAASPDLVLIRPMIDRGWPQLIQRLEQNGITVVSLQPGDIREMFVYWEILGILTGQNARAREMITAFQKQTQKIQNRVRSIRPKKRVYFEAIHKRMKTFTPDSMAIFVLETAGGVNVAKDAEQVRNTNIAFYGKERILSHAHEIDVFIAQHGAMNRPTLAMIQNEPGFQVIKAVQNNRILIIDEMIVSRPTLRLIQGIHKIGQFLYPEVFANDSTGD